MSSSSRMIIAVAFVVVLMMAMTSSVSAGYRKPPFNGSIFGKRSGAVGRKFFLIVYFLKEITIQCTVSKSLQCYNK